MIPALFLGTLGTLFLLDNLGLARFDLGNLVSIWWPALLIAAGVRQLLRDRERTTATC